MSKKFLDSILEVEQDDFLKVLYEYRNNEWGEISFYLQNKLKPIKYKKKKMYKNLMNLIKENLKDEKCMEKIQSCFQEYLGICNNEDSMYSEQYYNTGVSDGVKLMLQCFKKN